MTVVVDSSVLVAALTDGGPDGAWARSGIATERLVAPAHVYAEVSNVLRRGVLGDLVTREVASLAHRDLVRIPLDVFPFGPLADRVWDLHPSVTAYDAVFVALAEALDAPLWTLDQRLIRASGPRCQFVSAPS